MKEYIDPDYPAIAKARKDRIGTCLPDHALVDKEITRADGTVGGTTEIVSVFLPRKITEEVVQIVKVAEGL